MMFKILITNCFCSHTNKFIQISQMDVASPWQLSFSDPATPVMEGIINFHNDLMFFIVGITIFVLWMLLRCIMIFAAPVGKEEILNWSNQLGYLGTLVSDSHIRLLPSSTAINNESKTLLNTSQIYLEGVNHNTPIEIAWTAVPAFILTLITVPSFALLYSIEEFVEPALTIKCTGHQWYWCYEYSNCKDTEYTSIDGYKFESYMIPTSELEIGHLRLLEVDNDLHLPTDTHIQVTVTAADVLHSWAVPALGIKIDACPGRLNQTFIYIKRDGTFYGQCSEICGVNHGFMPIVVKSVDIKTFLSKQFIKSVVIMDNVDLCINNDAGEDSDWSFDLNVGNLVSWFFGDYDSGCAHNGFLIIDDFGEKPEVDENHYLIRADGRSGMMIVNNKGKDVDLRGVTGFLVARDAQIYSNDREHLIPVTANTITQLFPNTKEFENLIISHNTYRIGSILVINNDAIPIDLDRLRFSDRFAEEEVRFNKELSDNKPGWFSSWFPWLSRMLFGSMTAEGYNQVSYFKEYKTMFEGGHIVGPITSQEDIHAENLNSLLEGDVAFYDNARRTIGSNAAEVRISSNQQSAALDREKQVLDDARFLGRLEDDESRASSFLILDSDVVVLSEGSEPQTCYNPPAAFWDNESILNQESQADEQARRACLAQRAPITNFFLDIRTLHEQMDHTMMRIEKNLGAYNDVGPAYDARLDARLLANIVDVKDLKDNVIAELRTNKMQSDAQKYYAYREMPEGRQRRARLKEISDLLIVSEGQIKSVGDCNLKSMLISQDLHLENVNAVRKVLFKDHLESSADLAVKYYVLRRQHLEALTFKLESSNNTFYFEQSLNRALRIRDEAALALWEKTLLRGAGGERTDYVNDVSIYSAFEDVKAASEAFAIDRYTELGEKLELLEEQEARAQEAHEQDFLTAITENDRCASRLAELLERRTALTGHFILKKAVIQMEAGREVRGMMDNASTLNDELYRPGDVAREHWWKSARGWNEKQRVDHEDFMFSKLAAELRLSN